MGRTQSLKATSDGVFFRNIGYTETGSPRKYYLGADRTVATLACERLEKLWELVKEVTGGKVWTENARAIAHAIRKGLDVLVIETDGTKLRFPGADDTLWLSVFGEGVQVEVVEPMTPDERKSMLEASRQQARDDARELVIYPDRPKLSGHGLHDAIRFHVDEILARPKYRNESGELSAWGKGKCHQARYLLRIV